MLAVAGLVEGVEVFFATFYKEAWGMWVVCVGRSTDACELSAG